MAKEVKKKEIQAKVETTEVEKQLEMKKNKNKQNTKKRLKKIMNKIPKIAKITGIILVALILIMFGIKFSKSLTHKETVLDFGFKDVGMLVTQEYYGRILQDSTKDRKLFKKLSIPFTESRIIFSLDVEVLAGINFEEIEYEIKDDNVVKVKLPKSYVYKYYQVPNTYKNYLDDESWFTNIGSEERHKLEDSVVEIGKEEALNAGLLEKADANAKKIIEQMIKSKNKNLKIEWEYKEEK